MTTPNAPELDQNADLERVQEALEATRQGSPDWRAGFDRGVRHGLAVASQIGGENPIEWHLLIPPFHHDTKQRCTCGAEFVSRCEMWKHQADAYLELAQTNDLDAIHDAIQTGLNDGDADA